MKDFFDPDVETLIKRMDDPNYRFPRYEIEGPNEEQRRLQRCAMQRAGKKRRRAARAASGHVV